VFFLSALLKSVIFKNFRTTTKVAHHAFSQLLLQDLLLEGHLERHLLRSGLLRLLGLPHLLEVDEGRARRIAAPGVDLMNLFQPSFTENTSVNIGFYVVIGAIKSNKFDHVIF
jgi:hypothetical protein